MTQILRGLDRDHLHKWNHKRLHSGIGDIPPGEYEALSYRQHEPAEPA